MISGLTHCASCPVSGFSRPSVFLKSVADSSLDGDKAGTIDHIVKMSGAVRESSVSGVPSNGMNKPSLAPVNEALAKLSAET